MRRQGLGHSRRVSEGVPPAAGARGARLHWIVLTVAAMLTVLAAARGSLSRRQRGPRGDGGWSARTAPHHPPQGNQQAGVTVAAVLSQGVDGSVHHA